MICPDCSTEMLAVEYSYESPNRYDGISEWRCPRCGVRIGRWSRERLEHGEEEPRFGGPLLDRFLEAREN